MANKEVEIYFSQSQIDFVNAPQKTKVCIAGRGWGKSTVLAYQLTEIVREMPRSKGFFASTTIEQIKNSTLPPIIEKLSEFGYREDEHYVIGGRPPDWFKKPYAPPKKYENIITFFNGTTVQLISTAKPAGKRGGSYDWGIVDEAAFVKRQAFESVILKMLRGNRMRWQSKWLHNLTLLTSQPRTSDGYWLYEFEERAKTEPDKVLWVWESARSNIDVLGEEWFEEQERNSSHLDYIIEVENKRIKKLPNGFYHRFDTKRHTYPHRSDDILGNELLELSFDFSGKFNCMTVWQEQLDVERLVREYYTKDEGKVTALVAKFIKAHSLHEYKVCRLWGEPRGHDRNPIGPTLYQMIETQLTAAGWSVETKVEAGYSTENHADRFQYMELLCRGDNPALPGIAVSDGAECTIISMQTCDVLPDYRKDKSKEKDPNFPQEHAPHFSDTVDYYLYQKHGWKLVASRGHRAGSVNNI